MKAVKGARVIVTGVTSGLGKEIASRLASRGARVLLACGDVERGKRIAAEISTASCGPPRGYDPLKELA